MTDLSSVASVISVAPDLIQIEVHSPDKYTELGTDIEIGSYLKISDDNGLSVVAIVQSYKIKDPGGDPTGMVMQAPKFILDAQPVGRMHDDKFRRGGKQIAIPPTKIEVASRDVLQTMYSSIPKSKQFSFGSLVQDPTVKVAVDGDKFFGKHIGVVGSTGSGKSCTVAKILQEGMRPSGKQAESGVLNNSHIIIFDLHGEYGSAFPNANFINTDNLHLPYWLMNSEELEEMFIESNENNSHNQVSQFRQAVIENKIRKAEGTRETISYDSPVHFSLHEVLNYLKNLNTEVISKLAGENLPKLSDEQLVQNRADCYFTQVQQFVESNNTAARKASNGPFHGEFNRFIMRLEGRMNDKRLGFLLNPAKDDNSEYTTTDLTDLLRQFIGYGQKKSNITIIDLSGIPFEVLSVVVSLMTRLIFTLNFHLKKIKTPDSSDLPFLLVYEEAHNYIPQSEGAKYSSVKKSIERIAKEGRKYGISLMIVSQRPSEISETVFSQCNNFVAMRLTNPSDQRYVKRLLPDTVNAITDTLPTLEKQEAIIIGDSIAVPSLIKVDEIEQRPDSQDIEFHSEWKLDWLEFTLAEVVERWQGW